MNLVRITTRIYPDLGGPANHAYHLSKFSANSSLCIIAISCLPQSMKKKIKEQNIDENFKIIYLPFNAPKLNANFVQYLIFFLKFFTYGLFTLIRIHKKEKIDLVHVHTPAPSGYIAFIFKLFFKVPYIYTIHGMDYNLPFLFSAEIKIVAQYAKNIIIISRKIRKILLKTFKIEKRIHWIPNGVNPNSYYHATSKQQRVGIIRLLNLRDKIDQDDFIIIYIGYMIFEQKVRGMIDFMKAFKNFFDQIDRPEEKKHLKLIYIGKGKHINLLKKERDKLKLRNNVFLLGYRQNIKDILAISDLAGLTSYIEGFPNVILEYMASGVPCIGSNVGEIKTIINGAGFIVEPGDISAISDSVKNFYNSKELRKDLSSKSIQIVKDLFDWRKVAEKIKIIYGMS